MSLSATPLLEYLQWLHHLSGQPVPIHYHSFWEESFPNIPSEPPLVQLKAITLRISKAVHDHCDGISDCDWNFSSPCKCHWEMEGNATMASSSLEEWLWIMVHQWSENQTSELHHFSKCSLYRAWNIKLRTWLLGLVATPWSGCCSRDPCQGCRGPGVGMSTAPSCLHTSMQRGIGLFRREKLFFPLAFGAPSCPRDTASNSTAAALE